MDYLSIIKFNNGKRSKIIIPATKYKNIYFINKHQIHRRKMYQFL